jgi:hypothetical protein
MSNKRLGIAFIKADGDLLETESGATLDIGGVVRETVVGNSSVNGFFEKPKESELECTISVGPDTSLDRLRRIENATITFEADTGQTWIISGAWLAEPPTVQDSEGGKAKLKFAGPPAEEMK